MGEILTKEKWLEATAVRGKIRSSELRKLDDAIANYWKQGGNQSHLIAIRVALQAWKRAKGPTWAASERNRPPASPISALNRTLREKLGSRLTPDDQEAIAFIKAQRVQRIQQIFANAQINLRIFNAVSQVRQAADDLKTSVEQAYKAKSLAGATKVGGAAKRTATTAAADDLFFAQASQAKSAASSAASDTASVASAAAAAAYASQLAEIRQALSELFGEPIADVKAFLMTLATECGLSGAVAVIQHVADMLPVLSLISGGVKALGAAGTAVKSAYQQYSFSTHRFAIEQGAPAAAFAAVQSLLLRATANATSKAAIEAAGFGANVALHAAKGAGAVFAPAVKAATASANAVRVITMFAIQVREALIIRRALKNPQDLDLSIFQKAPLLGAYMLVGSDTSDLVGLLYESFGYDGWQDEIETLIRSHVHPVLNQCASLIQSSPFVITNIPLHRAVTGSSTLSALASAIA